MIFWFVRNIIKDFILTTTILCWHVEYRYANPFPRTNPKTQKYDKSSCKI